MLFHFALHPQANNGPATNSQINVALMEAHCTANGC